MKSTPTTSPRLRVVHVALQLDRGGLEKLLVEIARHADRSRFDLRFISISGRGALGQEIEACGWPMTPLGEPPGLRPGLIVRLARLFRDWRVDVVHTHNTKPLLYGGPAARLAGVPAVVHTCHGQRYGAGYRDTMLFALACCCADRVACVSRDSAEMRIHEGVPHEKVCTVLNGIDLSRFACHGPQNGGPAVLVSRLSPEKDVESLLHATALVLKQLPSFRLDIAGDGVQFSSLKQMASKLGIAANVRFLGEVRDVSSVLARASLFVLPSLTEGISLSLLEGMAQGLPVVATRVGGNSEVVVDSYTGLLVPPRDAPALARAMIKISSNPDRGREMGLAGRSRVEAIFDVRRTVANYETMYEEICPGRVIDGKGPAVGPAVSASW